MRRILFKSKIHRATVTHADVDYEGSVTIDVDLLRAADILPYEKVAVWNVTRGTRLETYALEGESGSATRPNTPLTPPSIPASPFWWSTSRCASSRGLAEG